jgi:hypothetical protein
MSGSGQNFQRLRDAVVLLSSLGVFIFFYNLIFAASTFAGGDLKVDLKRVVVLVTGSPLAPEDHVKRLQAIKETWGAAYPHFFILSSDKTVNTTYGDNFVLTPPKEADSTTRHRVLWAHNELWRR